METPIKTLHPHHNCFICKKQIIIVLFVETPRKFITAKFVLVSTNKTIICFIAMQPYKELIKKEIIDSKDKTKFFGKSILDLPFWRNFIQ